MLASKRSIPWASAGKTREAARSIEGFGVSDVLDHDRLFRVSSPLLLLFRRGPPVPYGVCVFLGQVIPAVDNFVNPMEHLVTPVHL